MSFDASPRCFATAADVRGTAFERKVTFALYGWPQRTIDSAVTALNIMCGKIYLGWPFCL